MTQASPLVRPVASKADRNAFVDLPYRLYASDPNWVPPLKDEVHGLITPGKNPWFEHGEAQLYLVVIRFNISRIARGSSYLAQMAFIKLS